ncbi:hypothetical protein PYCCODRAFT_1472832 [Trametes coccinea BRFM310]|uniref:Uncharacterized protein n=1 Tax=Trametes coccinea (strain BRFM310) TaxID=1353009 RepID=A0A1Y2I6A9_TRAC3|nr:hypothetical protein PYCCODRAFT_1472832 [Trametes coccinea BRFM310]
MLIFRSRVLRSSVRNASPFRQALRAALADEFHAGHLSLDKQAVPPRLCITLPGMAFFEALPAPLIRKKRSGNVARVRPIGPTRAVAVNEYVRLATIVKSIMAVLAANDVVPVGMKVVERLPQTIYTYLEQEQFLQGENEDLCNRVNALSWEVEGMFEQVM